jgi:hypothetical protein
MYNVYLHSNTDPIVDPELLTPLANCRIPLDQLSQGNLVVLLDRGAGSCRSYLVELLAVADHLGLNWRGRLDTIAGLGRSATNNTHANVISSPEASAVGTDGRIPLAKVCQRDLKVVLDG